MIRIKNAALAQNSEISVPKNKKLKRIASVLKKEGYITDYSEKDQTATIKLAYRMKRPVLFGLSIISRPGMRIYTNVRELEKKKGPSIYLISSQKGIITSGEAIKQRIGGEVIAELW